MTENKLRVLSGIRPTGDLHLGNYLGAIRQFKEMQDDGNECFFFVADLHALTTFTELNNIRKLSIEVIRGYLACGIDPLKSVMYCQSAIPYIPYLTILLSMNTSESWLRKCTTFKEKSAKQETVSLGLLSYPVLMASDVLIVNSHVVPVGHDQLQHLEMIRDIAEKFNNNFGNVFVLPEARMLQAIRVPGLDGTGKMGKSDGNTIGLFENPKSIKNKVMSAVTDLGPVKGQTMGLEMSNLYYLMSLCSSKDVYSDFKSRYDRCEQKFYGELKKQLAADIINMLAPLRERYHSPECSSEAAETLLKAGEKKVIPIARDVFDRTYEKFSLFSSKSNF